MGMGTSLANFDIPPGYGIPLVNLNTDLLPAPTMAALQASLDTVSVVTLASQAEYDALTTEEKNDPFTIYTVPV